MIRLIIFMSFSLCLLGSEKSAPKPWPAEVKEITYKSSIDKTQQPTLIYTAESKEKRPLLVGLHTWSSKYTSAGGDLLYAKWCIENDWHFVHPHFRGPNWTPKAMGSDYVVADIESIVDYMKKNYNVDEDRIYLIGGSGGGYASLLMAGRKPEIWAGVSAWVPISDIRAWWEQKDKQKKRDSKYARNIEDAVGGRPDIVPKAAEECIKRSAVTYLENAKGVNLDINHGILDGRKGSVPFTHSLYAFNKVATLKDRLSEDEIKTYYKNMKLPQTLKPALKDELYGESKTLFRRVSNNARVTIFQGGHEIIQSAALNWLANQRKSKPAVWKLSEIKTLDVEKGKKEVSR